MADAHITWPQYETRHLLAVISWCTSHGLEPRDVIEGRHPHVFDDATFPQVAAGVEPELH